jgi:hypothetical protein
VHKGNPDKAAYLQVKLGEIYIPVKWGWLMVGFTRQAGLHRAFLHSVPHQNAAASEIELRQPGRVEAVLAGRNVALACPSLTWQGVDELTHHGDNRLLVIP